MTDLLGLLQEEHGYLHHASGSRSVGETSDLRRIRDAERRVWQDDPDLPRVAQLLTKWLRHTPGRTPTCPPRCKGCEAQELLLRQAALIREAHDLGGAVGGLRPGAGKTLPSFLLPTVLKAERAVLLVPAGLREKTKSELVQYALHWRVGSLKIVTYEWASNPKQLHWFSEYRPDLVIADESHKLKDSGVKVWKRLAKYAKEPDTALRWFVPMSGSLAGRSIGDYWHYIRLALRSRAPLPANPMEAKAWMYAMDEKVPEEARFEPGALLTLAPTDPELDEVTRARNAYRDRFTSSRGIVFTADDVPPVGLQLAVEEFQIPDEAERLLRRMRETWATPDGLNTWDDPLTMWRHAQEMGCFGWQHWDPPPPDWWLFPRKAWHKFVRERLKRSQKLDSKVHLIEEIKAGRLDDGGLYAAWKDVEDKYKPHPVPVWVHEDTLHRCAAWLAANPQGICWVLFRAFGERLSQVTGIPYFRHGGMDAQGRLIDDYTGGPAIASVKSCMEGHNLQQFNTNLFSWVPSKGTWHEQILARTHREGQEADDVTGLYLLTCEESYKSLSQAIRDARCVQDRDGQPQRLLYSTSDFGPVADMIDAPEVFWDGKP